MDYKKVNLFIKVVEALVMKIISQDMAYPSCFRAISCDIIISEGLPRHKKTDYKKVYFIEKMG